MKKVVFVCLGNICRSPMAEFVMKSLTDDYEIESRATSSWEHGNPIHKGTQKIKITIEMVMKLRSHSGALTEAMVKRYLSTETIKKKCYKVPSRIVEKYFEGMDPNQVDAIVEQALEAWFSKEVANV